jgi:hypothetical protein
MDGGYRPQTNIENRNPSAGLGLLGASQSFRVEPIKQNHMRSINVRTKMAEGKWH